MLELNNGIVDQVVVEEDGCKTMRYDTIRLYYSNTIKALRIRKKLKRLDNVGLFTHTHVQQRIENAIEKVMRSKSHTYTYKKIKEKKYGS